MKLRAAAYDRPFDQFERYRAVGAILERLLPRGARVLDVGGEPGLLEDFLEGAAITVLNRTVAPFAPRAARGDGAALPFRSGTFDAAIACDALEHVSPAKRTAFVDELLRVASRTVVIASPFHDPAVLRAEADVREALAPAGISYPYLEEHLALGLPDLGAVSGALATACRSVATRGNGPLGAWVPMMTLSLLGLADEGLAGLVPAAWRLYNRGSTIACSGPSYRTILVGDKTEPSAADKLAPLADEEGARPPGAGDVASLVTELRRRLGLRPVSDAALLLRQIAHLTSELAREAGETAALRRERERLEGHARTQASHIEDLDTDRAERATYARRLEEELAAEKARRDEEISSRDAAIASRAGELVATRAEYARLEGYARDLELKIRELDRRVEEMGLDRARAEDVIRDRDAALQSTEGRRREIEAALGEREAALGEREAELRAARDRIEALRVHAENLSGILERVSASIPNRLLRRLRGGGG
ncbi:MAG: methyltransferase domain-containing protein [Acidobacteriota bacterium]